MNSQVEILKIGKILPIVPIKGTNIYDTSQFRKVTIMVVHDCGELFDYYVSILRDNCDNYSFLKTEQSIVGYPFTEKFFGQHKLHTTCKGIPDSKPIIGHSFSLNGGGWHTSKVKKIIDDCVIITNNSVYAIHDISSFRERKLNNLGI